MTKKRRKKRRPASAPAVRTETVESGETPRPATKRSARTPDEGDRAAPRGFGQPSPHPPLGESLLRGAFAAGRSPAVIAVAFVSLLLTWALFVAVGSPPRPRELALLMAVPPAHVLADVPASLAYGNDPIRALVAIVGFGVLRAVTFGLLIRLLAESLGSGRTSVVSAVRGLPRTILTLAVIYLVGVGLTLLGSQVLASFQAQLAIFTLAIALFLLAFAPVAAAADGMRANDALRRGFRAARLPGTRHLTFVMLYFLLVLYTTPLLPSGLLVPVTPSVLGWTYALVATFVHVVFLGVLVYRWIAVRDLTEAPVTSRSGR